MKELIRKILREEIITETRVKKSDRVQLYKDENIIVVVPLTHIALRKYANSCQWCINDDKDEWEDYHKGKHAVIIQRNPKKVKIGITGNPIPSEIFFIDKWDNGNSTFQDICGILGYEFKDEDNMKDYYLNLTNNINNFGTNIVYYSPENGIYDMEDNFLWNFNYEISDIPNVTPEVIKIMNDYLSNSFYSFTHQLSEQKLLKEEIEHGGGIFYHNSDYDIKSFIPQVKKTKKTNYLFFSNEPNTFIDRKFTYKVKLEFNPNKIFNTFRHITKYGIKYTLDEYKGEVLRLFENNTEYFIKEWENTGVDSVGEVMEYYLDEGGNEDDMVGLLYYFITKWCDSWAIIETDLFLNFIESKGYTGFVTQEEGLINIACKDFLSIDIINKQNMWDMN